ncbi:MAG: FAD-dependent oxidoreductase [Pseudomonadota bacterium]
MALTRRELTKWLGVASSGAAAFRYGYAAELHEAAKPPHDVDGRGARVLIIGGGVAGLTAAYELEQAGYRTTIVEARTRLGGRNWTWRDGEKVAHRDGQQTVRFAEADYFNAGPARIPGFHHNLLSYCRQFGVALEPFLYENQNAYFLSDACRGGERMRHRHARYSVYAAMEEVALEGLKYGVLTEGLDAAQKEAVETFLRLRTMRAGPFFAAYRGGMERHLDAGLEMPEGLPPIPLAELAGSPGLAISLSTFDWIEWQSSLMQPVGGMDRVIAGFDRHVRAERFMGTELVGLSQSDDGVACQVRERRNGEVRTLNADYCVVTAGLSVIASADLQLGDTHANAVKDAATRYEKTSKVAWSAKRRFWEQDDGIYGGASAIDGPAMQFWYPSSGFGSATGVMLGAYTVADHAKTWNDLSLEQQLARSAGYGRRLHDAFDDEVVAGYNIDWMDQRYSKGGWAWLMDGDEAEEGSAYAVLRDPDRRIAFAGDYLSQLSGWQEGAILSAHRAVSAVMAATKTTQQG